MLIFSIDDFVSRPSLPAMDNAIFQFGIAGATQDTCFGHFALAIEANQERHHYHPLLALPRILLKRSADKQIQQFLTATQLDIGAELDGIMSQQQWAKEFGDGDRHTFGIALVKVIEL
jgi:hypothetical protein